MSDIRAWLGGLGLPQYADAFEENEISIELLGELDQDLLKEIGITTLGHRLKILKAVKEGADAAPAAAAPPAAGNEERRQLTIQFCDLVGSTQISSRMDPEDYRELMRVYQETASNVILKYGGYVAQYLGDGILVYFGFPQAHEDDAQRAVRAGLQILDAMETLRLRIEREWGLPLAVRLGVYTGLVVIGEMGAHGRYEQLALGETPNIAARMQARAAPGAMVSRACG